MCRPSPGAFLAPAYLAQWRFWNAGLANRLIEDRRKRAHRHVSYPRSTAELIQSSRGMLHGNLVRSRSLDTLIVVKLRHTVFASLNAQRMHGLRCSSGGEAAPPPQSDWRVEPEPGEIKLLSEKR